MRLNITSSERKVLQALVNGKKWDFSLVRYSVNLSLRPTLEKIFFASKKLPLKGEYYDLTAHQHKLAVI